jgi:hypothetical protein
MVENESIMISIDVTQPLCNSDYGSVLFAPVGGSEVDYNYTIDGDSLLAGMYNVVVTDSFGCSETFDFEVVEPTPITIEFVDDEVFVTGGLEPYEIFTDTTDNVLYISVVDGNECESSAEFILTNVIEEYFDALKIFPNPVADVLYLDLMDVGTKATSIRLVSVDGKLIQAYSLGSSSLDVSQVKNGIHILQIMFENGLQISKKVTVLK